VLPIRSLHASPINELPTLLSVIDQAQPFVDTAIVSGTFWGILRGKVISIVIGNLLAGAVLVGIGKLASDFFTGKKNDILDKGKEIGSDLTSKGVEKFSTLKESKSFDIGAPDTSNVSTDALLKLFLCIFIDLVGDASMAVPFLGAAST